MRTKDRKKWHRKNASQNLKEWGKLWENFCILLKCLLKYTIIFFKEQAVFNKNLKWKRRKMFTTTSTGSRLNREFQKGWFFAILNLVYTLLSKFYLLLYTELKYYCTQILYNKEWEFNLKKTKCEFNCSNYLLLE